MIPRIIHFVFGMTPDRAGREMTCLHYLAIVTAWAVNRPERIVLHCQYRPIGVWWKRVHEFVELNFVEAPASIFGNPVTHPAHKADIIRLQQLQATGGIYLDLDVVCVRPFDPLLEAEIVLASEADDGLCNAVILARPQTAFVARWLDSYRDFDGSFWNRHSIERPLELARRFPQGIAVAAQGAFFFPFHTDPPHILWMSRRAMLSDPAWRYDAGYRIRRHLSKLMRCKPLKRFDPPLRLILASGRAHLRRLRESYCVHLWNQLWGDLYLQAINAQYVLDQQTNFARLIAWAVRDTSIMAGIRRFAVADRPA